MAEDINTENMIEFISRSRSCVVSFTNQKHINRIKALYEEFPDEFSFFEENKDGSVCAKFPLKWIKINPTRQREKRELTEEQREELRERLVRARAAKNG